MTNPKIKACPTCGAPCGIYKYESGWSRVECDGCNYIGPIEGRNRDAITGHNTRAEAQPPTQQGGG